MCLHGLANIKWRGYYLRRSDWTRDQISCVCTKESVWFSPVSVIHRDSYVSPRESFLSKWTFKKKRKWFQIPADPHRGGSDQRTPTNHLSLHTRRYQKMANANKPRTHTQLHLSPLQKRLFSILSAGDNRGRTLKARLDLSEHIWPPRSTLLHRAPPRCLLLAAMASGDIMFLFGHTRLCLHLQLFCNKIEGRSGRSWSQSCTQTGRQCGNPLMRLTHRLKVMLVKCLSVRWLVKSSEWIILKYNLSLFLSGK